MDDVLAFCDLLNLRLGPQGRTFALAAQRGYSRVSLTDLPPGEAWTALAAVCLWRACCYPKDLQLVMAGTTKSGQAWLRFLERICSAARHSVREHVLFSAEKDAAFTSSSPNEPVIVVLTPETLAVGPIGADHPRRTLLVMPDFNRVPTKWMPTLKSFVGPKDQWLVVLPD